jgi:hypothetical protein
MTNTPVGQGEKRKIASFRTVGSSIARQAGRNYQEATSSGGNRGGGNGGGRELELRINTLESEVKNIATNLNGVKEDIREVRNWGLGLGLGLLVPAFVAIGVLYLYINQETKEINKNVSDFRVATTEQLGELKTDNRLLQSQNESISLSLGSIMSSIDKLSERRSSEVNDQP